jgi:hypothetical protein
MIWVTAEGKPYNVKAFNAQGKLVLNISSTDLQSHQYQLDLPEEGVYNAVLTIDGVEVRKEIARP